MEIWYDSLDIPDEMKEYMKRTVPDYRMNLIDARHMSDEEIDCFQGDLKAFLLLLRDRFDREKLKSVVATHRETWYALSKIKNDQRYANYIDKVSEEEMTGGVNVDAALEYIVAEGRKEGRKEGREEGRKEGEVKGEAKVNRLGVMLTEAGRTEDFLKSLSDEAFQNSLFVEFGLKESQ